MPKGKRWPTEEEKQLKAMLQEGLALQVIAAKLGRSQQAVKKKIERLGLEVVVSKGYRTTTSIELPKELPSVEEALKILAGALKAAAEPGLDKVEVQRLQVVATLARTYKALLSDYIDYRGIEARLIEMEAKYARLTTILESDKAEDHAGQ